MTRYRIVATLAIAFALTTGAAFAAVGVGAPAELASAETLVAAVRSWDGSPETFHTIAGLLSQDPRLLPDQAARVAAAGPVAPNHDQLVQEIADLQQDASLDDIARGYRVAHAATNAQADALGVVLPSIQLAGHAMPSEALFALADNTGVSLTPQERSDAMALDALPADVAAALARTIDAFVAMDQAATRALAQSEDAPDWGETLGARLELLSAIERLQDVLPSGGFLWATASSPQLYNIDLSDDSTTYKTNYAFSIDGGGDDTYLNNAGGNWLGNCGIPTTASAFVDLGGNDTYSPAYLHHPNDLFPYPDHCGKNGGAYGGVGFLLDSGGKNKFGAGQSWGVNGGAIGPASLGSLFSIDGRDDEFRAGHYGTNGGGLNGGVGLLVNTGSGSTTVTAGGTGTNGGANNGGLGLLVDMGYGWRWAGHDGTNGGATGSGSMGFAYGMGSWDGGWNGVNGGANQGGQGTLVADGGSVWSGGDGVNGGATGEGSTGALYGATYAYAWSGNGANGGGADGGQGTLITTTCVCTGGSTGVNGGGTGIGSTGFLYATDGSFSAGSVGTNGGADTTAVGILVVAGSGGWAYSAGSQGTNGGARQGGVGILIDVGWASAHYNAGGQGVNGGGHSSGVGLLVDAGGNDRYTASGFGANGGGFASGRGMLIDFTGNDVYDCAGSGCNGASNDHGATGLLLDASGNDSYNGTPNETDPLKGPGLTGAQIDL